MKDLKIAICDDDQYMRNRVYELIKDYLVGKHMKVNYRFFNDGEALLNDSEIYNLVILDIEMRKVDGLTVKENLFWERIPSKIIFLTDHDELMSQAFGEHVYGFVSKNRIDDIYKFLDIFVTEYKCHHMISLAGEKFDLYNILYIKGGRAYCYIFMKNSEYKVVRKTLSEMEQLLTESVFVRIHRSYIVNITHIYKCEGKKVFLKNKIDLPISSKYLDSLESAFFNHIRSFR